MAETRPQAPQAARRSRVKLAVKILLPVAILGGAAYYAVNAKRPPVERNTVEERVWPVAAVPVVISDQQPELRLFGEVTAGRQVELRPLVAGRVVEVGPNFVVGGIVREGELLIAVDPFDYRANVEESVARRAETSAKIAEYRAEIKSEIELMEGDENLVAIRRREVKRRTQLRRKGSGSRKAVDDSQLALSEQRQRLIGRQQTIARLAARVDQQVAVQRRLAVAVARAQRDLEETKLLAPFDAFLVDIDIAVGKMVGTGDRVARLIDARWLEVRFQMNNDQFARLIASGEVRGRAATAIWRTAAREFTFEAEIERVSGEIDAASGGVDLFARIRQTTLATVLRPGAFVEIRMAGQLYRDVIRLPDTAVHGGSIVYAIVDGRLEPRAVEIVARAGNDLLVRGKLAANEQVVTTAFAEIGPGVQVQAR